MHQSAILGVRDLMKMPSAVPDWPHPVGLHTNYYPTIYSTLLHPGGPHLFCRNLEDLTEDTFLPSLLLQSCITLTHSSGGGRILHRTWRRPGDNLHFLLQNFLSSGEELYYWGL